MHIHIVPRQEATIMIEDEERETRSALEMAEEAKLLRQVMETEL